MFENRQQPLRVLFECDGSRREEGRFKLSSSAVEEVCLMGVPLPEDYIYNRKRHPLKFRVRYLLIKMSRPETMRSSELLFGSID
jgi:hypothetical protein